MCLNKVQLNISTAIGVDPRGPEAREHHAGRPFSAALQGQGH